MPLDVLMDQIVDEEMTCEQLREDYNGVNFHLVKGMRAKPNLSERKDLVVRHKRSSARRMGGHTVEQVSDMQRRNAIWVSYCSVEYRNFIVSLQKGDYKN